MRVEGDTKLSALRASKVMASPRYPKVLVLLPTRRIYSDTANMGEP